MLKSEKLNNKGQLISWAIYDWASSAFPTIIITFIFSTYFTKKIATNFITGTSQWGATISLAGLTVALLSPIIGAIVDNQGRRKPWLLFFNFICIISSLLLWFAKPSEQYVLLTLICVFFGSIGLETSSVFYNAMLNGLVPESYIGRLSGWGWGVGYFGGLISLCIALFVLLENKLPGIHFNTALAEQVRICGPFVAIWFLFFAWPLFVFVPDRPGNGIGIINAVKFGFRTLSKTIKSARQYKEIGKFLLARILYIDGLNTIFAFGGIYAAGTFHMSIEQVVEFGIAMNVGAGIGAISLAWLDDSKGAKLTILLALAIMIFSGSCMLLVHSKTMFIMLGLLLSFCVGPVQAASRSLLIHLAPQQSITEMFGLYSFSGRITAFLGPGMLSLLTYWFASQRVGMAATMLFLFIGMVILFTVKVERAPT